MACILVVDDDQLILRLLSEVLQNQGHDIVTATNGKLALECLDKNPSLQIVLLDLVMPGFDGRNVIEQIRANPFTKHLPVVLMTGSEYDPDLFPPEDSYHTLVKKPFDIPAIITLIEELINSGENELTA